ncbi:hypothetical protein [Ferruginivarius sediminum]|uniref:DUF4136 domain-containing protein n=1 Tax=Ferruginivarius sediminum TaxID=2661937 RepID=A0A369TK06_9PROT|nr:hypothetical protein [Ferruginivarius sediminum]RDD63246.1 hypothetical protein DRB17_01995 [Ferruginivarius sediminum]
MIKPFVTITSVALAAAAVAGCAGQPTIENTYRSSYDPSLLSYAASKGGMKTEILGAPFPTGERTQLERAVTNRLEQAAPGPRMAFFTEAPADYTSPYRVVLLFDPAPGQPLHDLCNRPDLKSQPGDGPVKVTAAFCSSDRAITRVAGSVGNVQSADDPAFQNLIGQIAHGLFPTNNIDQNNGAGDFEM